MSSAQSNISTISPDDLPIDNINIAIIGCVSAGKSTILNALFCEDYAQSKIKRTTMMPTIFVETGVSREVQSAQYINQEITRINKKIITYTENGTESGKSFRLGDFGNQLIFKVKKLENVQFSDKFDINIWDTPGLNDARTKDIYYDYLQRNFHLLNVIIFVVDIQNGLNTSDEIDILDFLIRNIAKHKKESGKNIKLVTIVNKADDMQLTSDGVLEIVEPELNEMYEQVENTIKQKCKQYKIQDNVNITPICSRDAHIYRMIEKYGVSWAGLTDDIILKIGINLHGKNFSRKSTDERRRIVTELIQNPTTVREMIELSGFEQMCNKVTAFIKSQAVNFARENVEYEFNRTQKINISNLISTLRANLNTITKLERFDLANYQNKMKNLVKEINTQIYTEITKYTTVDSVVKFYLRHLEIIKSDSTVSQKLGEFWDFSKYPTYIKDKVIEIINGEFTDHSVPISKFNYFGYLEEMDALNTELTEILLDALIKNIRGVNTFVFEDKNITNISNMVLPVFAKIESARNFIHFLRFFMINLYSDKLINSNEILITKSMYFKKVGEIPLGAYIDNVVIKSIDTSKYLQTWITGLDQTTISHSDFVFERYYINFIQNSDSINIK
jgi:small GTP-binding protein